MRTYPIIDRTGTLFALEIESVFIPIKTLSTLLERADGVSNVQVREAFDSSPDVHIKFRFRNNDFMVWEPYGDSSRYWIGPSDAPALSGEPRSDHMDISYLKSLLDAYEPPFLIKALGNLLSLRFLRRVVREQTKPEED